MNKEESQPATILLGLLAKRKASPLALNLQSSSQTVASPPGGYESRVIQENLKYMRRYLKEIFTQTKHI